MIALKIVTTKHLVMHCHRFYLHIKLRMFTEPELIVNTLHSTGLYCSVYWIEVCRIWCGCVGIWQCHRQLHSRPDCKIREKIHTIYHLHWTVSVLVSVPDLLQESGELSSCVFNILWIWTLRWHPKDWNVM